MKRRTAAAAVIAAVLLTACFGGNSAEQYLASAKADLAKQDKDAALIQLKNALQKDPALPEARFLLGQMLLESGDARGAGIELGKAQELGYNEDLVTPEMAQALIRQGQFQLVVSNYAETRLKSSGAMADLQASLAAAYGSLGQSALALETIAAAVAADAGNVRAQLIRVRLLAANTSPDEATKALEELLGKMPKSSEAWQLKGEMLARAGKADEALQAYREALTLDKNNVAANIGLMTLLLGKKDLDGATAQLAAMRAAKIGKGQVQMFTALLALERNDLKLAHESMQPLLKGAPEDPRVLHLAGAIEYRRGALLEAENYLGKAMQAAPGLTKARLLLAKTKLRQGDPTKALALLQPLLGEENNSVEAYSIAAEAYLQTGEPKRAEEYFTKASKLNPKDVRSRAALALVQINKGQVAEGVAALRSISASDPSPIADMGLITTFLQKRDFEQALKAIDGLQAKMPESPTAPNLRGRVELARGNKDKARQAFEAALKIDSFFFPATASLAGLDLEDKHPEAAAARFQNILETQPNSMPANMALIALSAKGGASKEELAASLNKLVKRMPTEAQPRLALIELQMQRKDYKAALAAAQDAAAALPDNPDVWRFLGQAQALTDDSNQAISSFNKLASLAPKSPEPQMLLADVYARQGDKAQQVQSLKRSLSIRPDYLPAQLALFANELTAGHFPDARRIAESVQGQKPTEPMGKALSGDVNLAQKNWDAAVADYRASLKLRAIPEVAVKLHRSLIAGGKGNDAKSFEAEWTSAHPQDAVFIDYLGNAALLQENFALAEQRYLAVLKIQPDNPLAANNLAWLLNRNKKSGALEYSEKANKLAPDQPAFMDTLAQIYADAGQLDKALEIQKRAVTLAPDMAFHRLHLARYYAAAGQKDQARTELSRLAAMGDKFAQQAEVTKLMATL